MSDASRDDLAIDIRGVEKTYGAVKALAGIDLAVRRGEFFGLLGPNGAGKSTLINIMGGLVRASAGTIHIHGADVVSDYGQARRLLGLVPQEVVFDPFFTVREVLALQAGYFGLGRENEAWRDELLEALMLTDKANANMRALSGGMKRRVLIAQALVHRPRVVILDEPTAGVDVELRQSLWAFVRRLHREGHTIVLTTHYLEEAEMLCERIAIMAEGRVVVEDTKDNLLARGADLTAVISVREAPEQLPDSLASQLISRRGTRLEFRLEAGVASLGDLLARVADAGLVVTEVHTSGRDLEDVFMDLTRRTGRT